MRLITLLLALSLAANAQKFSWETTTTKATVVSPSGANRGISFSSPGYGATVYCSSASTATLTQNGTAPTTTESSVVTLNGQKDTVSVSNIRVYTNSNVGSGTHIKTYTVAAGVEVPIDLTPYGLIAGESVTITTDNSCRIFFLGVVK